MNLSLRPADTDNVWTLCELDVTEEQGPYVTSSRDSFAEAWAIHECGGHPLVFGIYDGDIPVGFVMMIYGEIPGGYNSEYSKGNYEIKHFFIDRHCQRKGYGKAAMKLIVEYIKTLPCGTAEYCFLGYHTDNTVAGDMYHSLGFEDTGIYHCGEMLAILKI